MWPWSSWRTDGQCPPAPAHPGENWPKNKCYERRQARRTPHREDLGSNQAAALAHGHLRPSRGHVRLDERLPVATPGITANPGGCPRAADGCGGNARQGPSKLTRRSTDNRSFFAPRRCTWTGSGHSLSASGWPQAHDRPHRANRLPLHTRRCVPPTSGLPRGLPEESPPALARPPVSAGPRFALMEEVVEEKAQRPFLIEVPLTVRTA